MSATSPASEGVTLLDCVWLLALVVAVGSLHAWDRWQAPRARVTASATDSSAAADGGIAEPPFTPEHESAPRPDDAAPAAKPPASGTPEDAGRKPAPGGTTGVDSPDASSGPGPEAPARPLEPEALQGDGKPQLAVAAGTLPPPNQLDQVVDRFILHDIGQLPGPEGKEARAAFDRLGTESVPALLRGLNRAASLTAGSPVVVLVEKLQAVLQLCGPEMTELAVGQLGTGIPATGPHYYRLESLKQQLLTSLPTDHPLKRRIELAKRLSANPAQIPEHVRSDDPNERWAAARAIFICGAPLGDELTQLVGDVEPVIIQEARAGLVRLAGDKDFGPKPNADSAERERALADWRSWWFSRSNNAVFRRLAKMTDRALRAALQSQDAEERWAAVVLVGNRRLPCSGDLIGLLRDADLAVRRDARRTLVQFAEGLDFGPTEEATPQVIDEAVANWQRWLRLQELIQAFEAESPAELIAAFAGTDPVERLAAVRVARARKLDRPEEFIRALGDPQPEICQEARHALLQISGGSDFGPLENAEREAVQDAVARWQRWLRWHRLVLDFESKDEAELLDTFQSEEPLERWAAVSVSRRKGFRPGAALIDLLRDGSADVQQEARQGLVELGAGEYDFGPPETGDPQQMDHAVERWTTWWQREMLLPTFIGRPPEELAAAFRSPEVPQRWAAVAAARRVRAPLQPDLISLVRDTDQDVRQEARRALAQWAGGSDFGPPEDADPQSVETAAAQWEKWWAGEQERREAAAASALKLAQIVVETNPNAAQKRLQDVVTQFAGTEAAQTAQKLLNEVPQVASTDNPPRKSPPPTASRAAKQRAELAAEPAVKLAPEQLENEAGLMLRLAKMTLSHRPEMLRQRLEELIDRYPGTKAAQEARQLCDSPAAKPAPAGNAAKKD
jgi:hypothetical protein